MSANVSRRIRQRLSGGDTRPIKKLGYDTKEVNLGSYVNEYAIKK